MPRRPRRCPNSLAPDERHLEAELGIDLTNLRGLLRHPLLVAVTAAFLTFALTVLAAKLSTENGRSFLGVLRSTPTATATVTATATKTVTASSAPTTPPGDSRSESSRAFAQSDFVDQGGFWELRDGILMNKQKRNDTIWACGSPDGNTGLNCKWDTTSAVAEVNVPEGFSKFSSYVGLTDKSPSECRARVRISLDGDQKIDKRLSFGSDGEMLLNVDGARRLRLEANFLAGDTCRIGFGDATWS